MLIKTFKPNDIVSMKLITGEEIITKLVEVNESGYTVSKPLVLSITQKGPAMTPFLLTAEINDNIILSKNVVVATANTDKFTSDQYISGTTGIQPATSGDIGKLI